MANQAKKVKKYFEEETFLNKVKFKKETIKQIIGKDKIFLEAKTENQKLFINSVLDKNIMYSIATGVAGCGKTFISLVTALNLLLDDSNTFTKIKIFKSLKSLEHENVGTLPGDVNDKLKYTLYSYVIQLEKLLDNQTIDALLKNNIIEILPLGNLRGTSLNDINIFDEFQNISVENSETILTRLEENAKMIIIGDIRQRDFKDKKDNGLLFLTTHFKNVSPKIDIIEFNKDDSIRSTLIKLITEIFEKNV
jgi:phosphate starvation-inducible protein PhoH